MFVPIKATVRLANENTGHAQVIGIILFRFPKFSIIYPVGPVYYCPGHPSKTISSGSLKFYAGFQKVKSEPLENCDFVKTQGSSWISTWHIQNNIKYLQIEISKVKTQINRNIVVPNLCAWSKQNLSQLIHQRFGNVSISRLKRMTRKGLSYKPALFVSWPRQLKSLEVQPFMSWNNPLGSCFIWIFSFSMLEVSMDLPRLLWIYILLLHTPLDLYQGANIHLFTS